MGLIKQVKLRNIGEELQHASTPGIPMTGIDKNCSVDEGQLIFAGNWRVFDQIVNGSISFPDVDVVSINAKLQSL